MSGVFKARLGLVVAALSIALLAPSAAGSQPASPKIEFVDPMGGSNMAQAGHDLSPLGMFAAADGVVRSLIILLLVASVVSWTIGFAKWVELRRERRRLASAFVILSRAHDLATISDVGKTPVADMILNAEDEMAAAARAARLMPAEGIRDRIAIRLERLEAAARRRMGKGIVLLAIIGSITPFVGLFGTVWGIMNSFIGIANSQTTNLAVVAPGIAEALLVTAVGLVAAIPAGVMYNLFARRISVYGGELADASATVLCLVGREIDLRAERG